MKLFITVLLIMVVAFSLTGCGNGESAPADTGRVAVMVLWPSRSRLIPVASNSIKVEIMNGSTIIATQLLARPSSGGTTTVTFSPVPLGSFTVLARAYPQSDGSGTAQASGLASLNVQAGKTTNFTVTMASAIASLVLVPSTPSVATGKSLSLTVTAKDATGNMVLTAPSQFQWTTSNAAIAGIDSTGNLTGVAVGDAQISVTDTESHVNATTTASVTPSNIVQNPANGHWYASVDFSSLITWQAARDAASALRFRGLRGHLATLTTQAESDFVTSHFPGDNRRSYWAGGYQDTAASDYSEPSRGWRWVTGEPWAFTNWGVGEPNDDGNFLNLFPGDYPAPNPGKWNDAPDNDGHGYGYVVEFE